MPFQFGTNWSRYSDATANMISPLLAYEGLTAFFLESAFLGVLLFGRKLVPRWAHFVAALMVAIGTLFSSFWILPINSWMQTPAGYEIVDGRFCLATGWRSSSTRPSLPAGAYRRRLLHDDRLRRGRRRRLLSPARALPPRGPDHAVDDAVAAARAGAAADRARRRSRARHAANTSRPNSPRSRRAGIRDRASR